MKKSLKGFTLTEVLVTLVILGFIITLSSGMIIMSTNLVLKDAQLVNAQNQGISVFTDIEKRIKYADKLLVTDKTDEIDFEEACSTKTNEEKILIYDNVMVKNLKYEKNGDFPVPFVQADSFAEFFSLNDELLNQKDTPYVVYNPEILKNEICSVSLKKENRDHIILSVQIFLKGELKYERTGRIKLINASAENPVLEFISKDESDEIKGNMYIKSEFIK